MYLTRKIEPFGNYEYQTKSDENVSSLKIEQEEEEEEEEEVDDFIPTKLGVVSSYADTPSTSASGFLSEKPVE